MRRHLLILAVLPLVAACGEERHTPIEWCIERIKEKDLFVENKGQGLSYSYSEAVKSFEIEFDKVYFVDLIYSNPYGEWAESWVCGISFKAGALSSLAKSDVTALECTCLTRFSI